MEKNLKCIICIGVPASGKSTWAKEQIKKHPNLVRLNRDSYRYMLKDQGFTEPKIESMITTLFFHAIDVAFSKYQSIIIDNTNVKESVIKEIIAYVEYRADVEFMLFDISLEKAIERDLARENPVGELIINKMYEQYVILMDSFPLQNQSKKKFVYKEPIKIKDLPSAVIFDLDGTLAHANGKRSYVDWAKTDVDDLDETIFGMYKLHKDAGDKIIIVTGRSEEAKKPTTEWLNFYGIKYDHIFMRGIDDHRKDNTIKKLIFETEIKDKYNIRVVYDDRQTVVDMWRSLGLKVLQVEKGYH